MLFGREALLETLSSRLDHEPICVVGETGIGKTALLRAVATTQPGPTFEAGCLSLLNGVSYLPIRRAFGDAVVDDDPESVAAALIERVGEGCLIVDDLQWADRHTLEVVGFLGAVRLLIAIRTGAAGTPAATQAAERIGAVLVSLPALDGLSAASVVRSRQPALTTDAVDRIVEQGAGNPLLLEELALAGPSSATLEHLVAMRIDALSPEGRESLGRLSLLSHTAARDIAGDGLDELVDAHLAVTSTDGSALRHGLFGEALLRTLPGSERTAIHSRLADLLDDPAEQARHLAAAERSEEAKRVAIHAANDATTLGDRARLLGLAASCSTGPEADRLRLDSAGALIEAGEYIAARELALAVESRDDTHLVAEVALRLGQSYWYTDNRPEARVEIERGLDLVANTETPVEARLRIETVRFALHIDWDAAKGIRLGEEALDLAIRVGTDVAKARTVLGTASLVAQSDMWAEHLEAAIVAARSSGDAQTEFMAANSLATALFLSGQPERVESLVDDMLRRADALKLRGWHESFLGHRMRFVLYPRGRFRQAIEACEAAQRGPFARRHQADIATFLPLAKACLGDYQPDDDTSALAPNFAQDPNVVAAHAWGRCEAAWLSGRPDAAVAAADECVAAGSSLNPMVQFAAVVRARSLLELGLEPGSPPPPSPYPALRCVELEYEAITTADSLQSATRFDDAAMSWRNMAALSVLRCEWSAAEAARIGGDLGGAKSRLLDAEQRAIALELEPMVARIRRSLRLIGERRTTPATDDGTTSLVSGQERRVLDLVGQGMTSAEIARRLGLGTRTVDAMAGAAMRKLGAHTRLQAALMLEGQ